MIFTIQRLISGGRGSSGLRELSSTPGAVAEVDINNLDLAS